MKSVLIGWSQERRLYYCDFKRGLNHNHLPLANACRQTVFIPLYCKSSPHDPFLDLGEMLMKRSSPHLFASLCAIIRKEWMN